MTEELERTTLVAATAEVVSAYVHTTRSQRRMTPRLSLLWPESLAKSG
jgi:predicted transcriptional regulator